MSKRRGLRVALVLGMWAVALAVVLPTRAQTAGNVVVVADGDSLTAGSGLSAAASYPANLALMHPDWTIHNVGVGGDNCVHLAATAATRVDPFFEEGKPGVVVNWCGSNDLAQYQISGRTANNTFHVVRDYALARRAVGWKVVAVTLMARNNAGTIPEAVRQEYNGLLRSTLPPWAKSLVDV